MELRKIPLSEADFSEHVQYGPAMNAKKPVSLLLSFHS